MHDEKCIEEMDPHDREQVIREVRSEDCEVCRLIRLGRADEREQAALRVSTYLDSTPDWVAQEVEAAAFGEQA